MFQSVSLPTDANPTYIMYSGGIGYVVVVLVVVAAVVFDVILTHSYDAVRGKAQLTLFSVPCLPSPFLFLPLLLVTHIWGHVAGSSAPSILRFVPFRLFGRRFQLFRPSSTHSRRIVPTHATRSINGHLSFSFCN